MLTKAKQLLDRKLKVTGIRDRVGDNWSLEKKGSLGTWRTWQDSGAESGAGPGRQHGALGRTEGGSLHVGGWGLGFRGKHHI